MIKRWAAKPAPDSNILESIRKDLKVSDVLLQLIAQRNISSIQEAFTYFTPDIKHLHDPFLMQDMEKAVDRIIAAMEKGEKILVYGDYDVDGTTSVALVYSFLETVYPKLYYYIPDRFKEGYGISMQSVDWAKEKGITLIIALDCGIKANAQVEYANTLGIDYVICDHHTPGDIIPDAFAILNPKRKDCSYPYKELSGCGIGFKLVQAIATKLKLEWNAEDYLDLVAVSIASDIVPVTGENRTLVFFGLNRINTAPRAGIYALMQYAAIKTNMQVNDLVFKLGPRINAAGRVASGSAAVAMLIEKSKHKAIEMAAEVNKSNSMRKEFDSTITIQALKMLEDDEDFLNRKTTVLFNPEWHKGVIGIVASRLIDKYYRPTVMLTESNGYAVGSARSVPGFNLYEAIAECADVLDQWGGHHAAAGLTMKLENIDLFKEKFEAAVSRLITDDLLVPVILYDLEIPFETITLSFCKTLERFGPFGPENMKPVFMTKNLISVAEPRIVGNNHLLLSVSDGSGLFFRAIGFGLNEYIDIARNGMKMDICYTIEPNEFRGEFSVNLNIKDIKPSVV